MKYKQYNNRIHLFYGKAFWVALFIFFAVSTLASLEVLGITNLRRVHAQEPLTIASAGLQVPLEHVSEPSKPRQGLSAQFTNVSRQGNVLNIRAAISMNVVGKCQLELSHKMDSAIVRKTSSIILLNNGAVCEGFTVGVSELPTAGDWIVTLKIVTDQGASESISQTVTIQK